MKKYELTEETKEIYFGAITLHRIVALVDFGNVRAGDIGGWIEKEENLAQDGNAWVYGDAMVYDNAMIHGDAMVCENAQVSGGAKVFGSAWVCGNARVSGDARVFGNAQVSGDADVSCNATVYGRARVYDNAQVFGSAWVLDSAQIFGNAQVSGSAEFLGNAAVRDNTDYIEIGPIGSHHDTLTFMRNSDGIIIAKAGWFFGSLNGFLKRVKEVYGNNVHAEAYLLAAKLAELRINATPINDEGT